MIGRRRLALGAASLVAAAQYFVAEALAASAWSPPGYSYSRNYISDLGRTACAGHHACSPWAVVMNTGFVLGGVLSVTAAALLAPLIRPLWVRVLAVTLACMHGAGSVLVGFAHGGASHAGGLPSLHVLGAYMAILGGNLTLIALSFAVRPAAASRLTALLGLFGLSCALALVRVPVSAPGLLERGAVDTATIWEVATGLNLVLALRRRPVVPIPA